MPDARGPTVDLAAGGATVAARGGPQGADGLRRALVLRTVAELVTERGVDATTVSLVTARASISRQAFHQMFSDIPECLVAIVEEALDEATSLTVRAFAETEDWIEGMREAMAAVLCCFDERPDWAWVCLIESAAGARSVREHHDDALRMFLETVVDQIDGNLFHLSPLAPEGMLASVVGVARAQVTTGSPPSLVELLGPLIGLILTPFLEQSRVRVEIERGDRLARELLARRIADARGAPSDPPPSRLPAVLLTPRAHRLRSCLLFVVGNPGASNREIGVATGIAHRAQISRLLARLAALGLVDKEEGGPGHSNAWSPTPAGNTVAAGLKCPEVLTQSPLHDGCVPS